MSYLEGMSSRSKELEKRRDSLVEELKRLEELLKREEEVAKVSRVYPQCRGGDLNSRQSGLQPDALPG